MTGLSLFPLEQPILPEERQIGRRQTIDDLFDLTVNRQRHSAMFDERRVGKTSVALAMLDRVRRQQWGLDVTLQRGRGIKGARALGAGLATAARAAGVRVEPRSRKVLKEAAKWRGAVSLALQTASDLLEVELGEETIDVVSGIVEQRLAAAAEQEAADLQAVLEALDVAAILKDATLVVFIDEIQEVSAWGRDGEAVQDAITARMKHPGSRLVFVFAGSEPRAGRALLAEGQAMAELVTEFGVPPISRDDWHDGLVKRSRRLRSRSRVAT